MVSVDTPAMSARLLLLLAAILIASMALFRAAVHAGDTGWVITSFQSDITIERDGSLTIVEAIDVDFLALEKHGIYRDIPIEYAYDPMPDKHRVYDFDLVSVTDAAGKKWPVSQSRNGADVRLQIGDGGKTIGGKQSYRITYRVAGVLNAFDDHDELYWNVNGFDWGVPTLAVSAVVQLPGGGLIRTACFQGEEGSTAPCTNVISDSTASALYAADGSFSQKENLTVVAGIRKGIVPEPVVILRDAPKNWFQQNFPPSAAAIGSTIVLLIAAIVAFLAGWWRQGRDRVYRTLYYLTHDASERTRPLFYKDAVVVEYSPPDELRPAQLGLILDERADTKDVTATIIDLAVRGYLMIEEKDKTWFLGKKDWHLTKKKDGDGDLLPFENEVLSGLFVDGGEVDLSDLKNKFHTHLATAQEKLYEDGQQRKWFSRSPESSRNWAQGAGIAIVGGGAGLGWLLGNVGWVIVAAPVVLFGVLVFLGGSLMSKRSAAGSEALRRALGFRLFIETADKHRQEFNERTNIFAEYLPYAIVFGSVHKWAKAFEGIDTQASTQSWYTGTGVFMPMAFSQNLETFSSSVSGIITSTPGSSGSSGFGGGGSSGGGGGGGGGGSW